MRKFFPIALLLLAAVSCESPSGNRLLSGNKVLKGIGIIKECSSPEGFPGMTVIETAFVNNSGKAVTVTAAEGASISVESPEIWSFQPTSTAWRKDWAFPIGKGFYQRNYLGMNDPDYGGGIPMVTLWAKDTNISVGIAEDRLKLVSMPVTRKGNKATACIREDYDTPVTLAPGDTLHMYRQFVLEGGGDFFGPLRTFSEYMTQTFGWKAPVSPESASFCSS